MQIITFSNKVTILIDILAWFIIHMFFAWLITQLSVKFFNPTNWYFRSKKWENDGKIYDDLFRIRKWKKRLPDGAALFKKGFKKGRLTDRNVDYFERFAKETCRGELAHWLVILVSPIFFLWNQTYAGFIMIGYALIANVPCIIAQRYNRPVILRLLHQASRKSSRGSKTEIEV